ncbi:amidase [uncultured Methylibium sp.]|uniref:amidase n=1 Tax=uncultured Methylibium sp. TaxID=381093 RepID=UPI0025D50D64|nr:amidase [uncultured Methylibium sp.]
MSKRLPNQLEAWEAAALIARRELSAEALLIGCLERIAERESAVRAFAVLDADAALARARALDAGSWRGPLHGLPLGVKDLFDTADLPTSYGTAIHAGHRPAADAAAVALCLEAGAVLVGKTETTELATMQPAPTRNPHDAARSPGGSSSGSVAAVADCMLPIALGTQTAGSIIRPAAYCGVVGYKPSLGRVPRAGLKLQCESMDTAGGFGRSVRDAALLGSVLLGDERLRFADTPAAPSTPRIGLVPTPWWSQADADVQAAWVRAVAALAPHGIEAALPAGFDALVPLQKRIMFHEAARSLSHERVRHREALSPGLQAMLDEGLAIPVTQYQADLVAAADWRRRIDALFDDHDLLLAPSTTGEAPTMASTGDPLFCRPWSLLGLPCVHLPFARGAGGLPVGLQVVGRHGDDHRLLAAAHWVHQRLLA